MTCAQAFESLAKLLEQGARIRSLTGFDLVPSSTSSKPAPRQELLRREEALGAGLRDLMGKELLGHYHRSHCS